MPITSFRAVEPLYIVILRNNNQAEHLFKSWAKANRINHANIAGNRMMLHDQHSFEQFRITWAHDMSTITVWDTWQKRHIYLD
jgi:hypothetical protein